MLKQHYLKYFKYIIIYLWKTRIFSLLHFIWRENGIYQKIWNDKITIYLRQKPNFTTTYQKRLCQKLNSGSSTLVLLVKGLKKMLKFMLYLVKNGFLSWCWVDVKFFRTSFFMSNVKPKLLNFSFTFLTYIFLMQYSIGRKSSRFQVVSVWKGIQFFLTMKWISVFKITQKSFSSSRHILFRFT